MSKKINLNKINLKNNKLFPGNNIFSPILEESVDSIKNFKNNENLNISSIPNSSNINIYTNNCSFDKINLYGIGSSGQDKTINKFHPILNLSNLPTVFEKPLKSNNKKKEYNEDTNVNTKIMRGSRLNLKPIINNDKFKFNNINNNNSILNENSQINNNYLNILPPINNHTYYKNKNNSKEKEKGIDIDRMKQFKLARNKPQNRTLLSLNNYKFNNEIGFNDKESPNYNLNVNEELMPFINKYNNKYKNTLDKNYNTGINITTSKSPESFSRTINKNHYFIKNQKSDDNLTTFEIDKKLYNDEKNLSNYLMKKSESKKKLVVNTDTLASNKNEFISINKLKTKVMHIPSLKIYSRYDIKKEDYSKYENYLKIWNKIQKKVNISYIFENERMNCFHIIVERAKNGNIGNCLKMLGGLNSNILKKIINQIILIIIDYNKIFTDKYNNNEEMIYNYIDNDNLCINQQYDIVLYPSKLKKNNISNNKKVKDFMIKIFNLNNKDNNMDNINYNNIQLNIDLMNLGINLININIFSLGLTVNDLFEFTDQKIDEINFQNYCCLFHYFYNNIKIISNIYRTLKELGELNEDYISFLHIITSFSNNDKNNAIEQVKEIDFVKEKKDENNLLLSNSTPILEELIKTGKMYNLSYEYYGRNSEAENFDIICQKIKKKINVCKNYFEFHHIKNINSFISSIKIEFDELSHELFIPVDELNQKLIPNYEEFFKN